MSTEALPNIPTRIAHDGFELPVIGLGTYNLRGDAGARAIASAIDLGYDLIDSAVRYENEEEVGEGIRQASRNRDELIITSKLPGSEHERALESVEKSLERMKLDTIDLYLIHWPNPGRDQYVTAWEGLIEAKQRGLVGAIGVSNFLPEHIERLVRETGVKPSVNQIEFHPREQQAASLRYCAQEGILVEAWTPMGRPRGELAKNETVMQIAEARQVDPAQVLLAWAIQRSTTPIPKSSDPGRQASNLQAAQLRLNRDEIAAISALAWPADHVNEMHPATHVEL